VQLAGSDHLVVRTAILTALQGKPLGRRLVQSRAVRSAEPFGVREREPGDVASTGLAGDGEGLWPLERQVTTELFTVADLPGERPDGKAERRLGSTGHRGKDASGEDYRSSVAQ